MVVIQQKSFQINEKTFVIQLFALKLKNLPQY